MTTPELHRFTVDNGLRVLLAPDRGSGVIAASVHYDVGFRSEPEGRTGFAHLFEHLMFQGSESLEKLAHFRHVQGSGGSFNGSTHPDYTDYFATLPSAALERVLFLEADRMRAPRLTEENLRNQVDVVKEEIRLNVMNRPYGGFPWITLPPVLYRTFPNAHNGYGDFTELEQATVEDCAAFFDTFYTPANAVLTVAGDFDVATATTLVHKHFGDVPARPAPPRRDFDEPTPTEQRTGELLDKLAPLPALAIGYRLPDPATDLPGYMAHAVLADLLTDGDAARLQQRMVHAEPLAVDVSARCGLMGAPLDSRNPDAFTLTLIHPAEVDAAKVLTVLDEELAALGAEGPGETELARVGARWAASLHGEHDRLTSRALNYGSTELLHGRAELIAELPELIRAVTPDQIAAAAAALVPNARAVLSVVPGGDQ